MKDNNKGILGKYVHGVLLTANNVAITTSIPLECRLKEHFRNAVDLESDEWEIESSGSKLPKIDKHYGLFDPEIDNN